MKKKQTRRQFFKEAAKKTLPVLGAAILMSNPIIAKADEKESLGCNYGCAGTCSNNCTGTCITGCYTQCYTACFTSCQGSCKGGCKETCSGSCRGYEYFG